MAQRIFNKFTRVNSVAFWITIGIGIALLICLVFLFVNYTIASF